MATQVNKRIATIIDKESWGFLIDSCVHSDFYHTYDYHITSKGKGEEAILIRYSEDGHSILLPVLIRKIEGTIYKDATSVYGYPGPLVTNTSHDFDYGSFKSELQKLFMEMNIISIFSRLNPFIPCQENVLNGCGDIETAGNVINIDLSKTTGEQESAYQGRLRTYINKSRRLCTIKKAETDAEVLKFIDMYYGNMKRVNAKKNYFFEKRYFFDLMNSTDFKTEILLTIHNETQKIIGGAMFIKKSNIVQYHLSGTIAEYLYLNPVKLMIDEMRIIATKEKYTYFNLGGGVGSKEDSLFRFKSNFSKDFRAFKVWKCIVNKKIYDEQVVRKLQKPCAAFHEHCNKYFPAYRCDH
tara:strand:+ start:3435 stop:4496 length:1062 start_codon:yes stop_codon:yes gene_type:complete